MTFSSQQPADKTPTTVRDTRLDFMKALSICFVLYMHLNPIVFTPGNSKTLYTLLKGAQLVFTWEVELLAVPIFYLVSLYLFFKKCTTNCASPWAYTKKRLVRLIQIFLFWATLQTAASILITQKAPAFSYKLLLMGGPDLPHTGDSVFYFIFCLILLTLSSWLFLQLPAKAKAPVGILICVLSVVYFIAASLSTKIEPAYYQPTNFFVYIPIAYWLNTDLDWFVLRRKKWLMIYLLGCIIDIINLKLSGLHGYSRITSIAGALALFSWLYAYPPRPIGSLMTISMYSLGLFALHKFPLSIARWTTQDMPPIQLGLINISTHYLISSVITLLGMFLLIKFIKETPLCRFIA